jgi:hypothetical protein
VRRSTGPQPLRCNPDPNKDSSLDQINSQRIKEKQLTEDIKSIVQE